jgi:prephenate dehydrogenase
MGGSLALALKAAGYPSPITGVSRSAGTRAAALQARAVDGATADLAAVVSSASLVVLATPVRTILRQLPVVAAEAPVGTVITDLGSTKAEICSAMAELPARVHPVGGHPMCGKESSGFEAADASLFRGKPWAICPVAGVVAGAADRVRALAEAAGARVLVLEPAAHDRAVAAISHLPYAMASALASVASQSGGRAASALASSGFRDTSRVAASDPEMMLDVFLTNRGPLLEMLDGVAGELGALRAALAAGDEAELLRWMETARAARDMLQGAGGAPN